MQAAAQGAEASREQILLNVEANYLATLQAQAVLDVARQTLASRKLLVEQVTALARNQLQSELDVSFAEVALEQAELLMQKSQGDVDGAMAALGAALGRKDTGCFILDRRSPVGWPAPGVVHPCGAGAPACARICSTFSTSGTRPRAWRPSEKDANYPTLAAIGVLGNSYAEDTHLPDKYAAAGVQLSIPIFEGGALVARQHQAEIRARSLPRRSARPRTT